MRKSCEQIRVGRRKRTEEVKLCRIRIGGAHEETRRTEMIQNNSVILVWDAC